MSTSRPLRPGYGENFKNWINLLIENGFAVQPKYAHRLAAQSLVMTFNYPFRVYDWLKMSGAVAKAPMPQAPVFLIGHWRSGTTHLHNIMSQDPQWAYVTTLQTVAPRSFISCEKVYRPVIERLMPETRDQDNVAIALDLPQEEEIALGSSSSCCSYSGWAFPSRMMDYFRAYTLFEGIDDRTKALWRAAYLDVLKRASLYMPGKRLLLKNPPNTARIPTLLDMWPEGKFVHIVRNHFNVYMSTVKLYKTTMAGLKMQDIDDDVLEENILTIYEELMGRYLRDRDAIPKGQLVEVRFEDLERAPFDVIERIYRELDLPGFDEARPRIEAYLDTQKNYTKNAFTMDDAIVQRVRNRWGFALDAFNYDLPA